MKRFAVVMALLVAALGLSAAPGAPRLTDAGGSALSAFLKAAVEHGDVPGIVVEVVDPDRVLYHGAFGKLNVAAGTDMPEDAIFQIASMTKPITSVAIMMLI